MTFLCCVPGGTNYNRDFQMHIFGKIPSSSSERTASAKTAIKHSVAKKPGDLKVTAKTKTTKVESPKQNGVAPTHITEEIKEITVVNNVINGSDSDLLVKDNSPLDNKMLIETSNNLIDTNPAD